MDGMIGTSIGPYQIVEEFGRGGMAVVYKAFQQSLNRYVAIKVLHQPYGMDEEFVVRFKQEALAAARLSHPNIVHVYDAGTAHGRHYIAMAFVEGGTLTELIRQGPLESEQAISIAAQLADALEYAHSQGVIHRDIKPGNVLLTRDGRPLLSDFGIAKVWADSQSLTRTGTSFGTPEYMAPEQIEGRTHDGRTDIYSLGVVLYEMLAGTPPFKGGDSPMQTMYAHVHRPPPPLRDINPQIPDWLSAVVAKALAKGPDDRYQRASDMAGALRRGREPGKPKAEATQPVAARSYPAAAAPKTDALPWPSRPTRRKSLLSTISEAVAKKFAGIGDALTRDRPSPSEPPPYLPPPVVDRPRPVDLEVPHLPPVSYRPSMRLAVPEWASPAEKHLIEDLVLQQDLERLKSFVITSQGGRFLLTGYGRFGGTSLVKGAMSQARREMRQAGLGEGALLVFYFRVRESGKQTGVFEIEANEFSFGTLTTEYSDAAHDSDLYALQEHADLVGPHRASSQAMPTCDFSLTTPLDVSFFGRSGLTGFFTSEPATQDLDFPRLVSELNSFFETNRQPSELQEIVHRLLGSQTLPSRIVIILDRIGSLETLEALANLRLFRNQRITVLAVARKEDFDEWEGAERRLAAIRFRKWYVPGLWQSGNDYIERIEQALLEPSGVHDAEAREMALVLRRHLEFVGRGALGGVLEELQHPQYWSSQDGRHLHLELDALPHKINIQHNAWMQDVLDQNWPGILGNWFVGKDMDERLDRARLGVYYLVDWVASRQLFAEKEFLAAANRLPITVSDNRDVAHRVAQNLLQVLKQNSYVRLFGSKLEVSWDPSEPRQPIQASVSSEPVPVEPPSAAEPFHIPDVQMPQAMSPPPPAPQGMPHSPPVPESPETGMGKTTIFFDVPDDYDLAAIRRLLLASFTAEELRRFCWDRPSFRPVVADFGPGSNKNDMVDRVLEHCETRILFDTLLHDVAQIRPRQFSRFAPQLRLAKPSRSDGTEPDTTKGD